MQDFTQTLELAFQLVLSGDQDLIEIVLLSLHVNCLAVLISCVIGLPIGASLAVTRFPGRAGFVVLFNALMGLPPVVVGLVIYMLLSKGGPLGVLDLLYTPSAMVLAQVILVTPIIVALSRQVISELHTEYDEQLRSLSLSGRQVIATLLWDGRYNLLIVALAGFGRAVAEVGAVLIVGGNINHVTRIMTTTITLETSKGNLQLALALGIILLSISLILNLAVTSLRATKTRSAYA